MTQTCNADGTLPRPGLACGLRSSVHSLLCNLSVTAWCLNGSGVRPTNSDQLSQCHYTFFPDSACIMPALVAPPRHCIPDVTRKVKGESDAHVEDLQPFACGMTGRSVEVLEPQSCEVQGTFPHWLQGQLYRNGPGVWDVETKSGETFSLAHWYSMTVVELQPHKTFQVMLSRHQA